MRKILLGCVLVFATLFTNVLAEDNPRAVIIFDASGSMWGQINGVTKIEIARDAFKNVVREWNPNVELGLTVYGHRSKGDCNDIESVIPVGKVDKNRVIRTVMGIKPKGKTPISRSLRKVAEEIKYTEEKATIILISDGKETCDPDPCGTAKELEKEGIDFITHVIGFNVDKKTDAQLECIAHATGGEYFSAKNAVALNKAMKVIVKKVEVTKPKKLEKNLQITASETESGKLVKALHQIYKDIGGKMADKYEHLCESDKKEPCFESVPAGKYIIVTHYNKYKIKTPVEVKDTELTKVNIITGQTGEAKIFASETDGGKWVKSFHFIYKVVDGEAEENNIDSCESHKKEPCLKRLPVGKYVAKSSYNKFKKETAFEIKSDTVVEVPVAFSQTQIVEISASETEGGKWVKAYHVIYVVEDGETGRSVDNCWSNKKEACLQQLPVGKYVLKSKYNKFKKETPFELKAGEATKLNIVFGQTSKVEISASETEGGKWVKTYHVIYAVEDGETGRSVGNCWSEKKEACLQQLPVGKYVLKSKYNKFKKETPVEIKADEAAKLNVVFAQTGKVEITASETEGGKPVSLYGYIYPVDENGEKDGGNVGQVNNRNAKEPSVHKVPVGKYIMIVEYNKFKKEVLFEVKAGETNKVHVVMGETGKVEVSASEKEGGKWVKLYGYIYPADENGKKDGGNVGQVNNRNAKDLSVHKLPVGKYIMKVAYNNIKKEVVFEVKAGETNKVHVVMGETGKVEVSASEKEGGKWISAYHDIVQNEDGKAGDRVARANSSKKSAGKAQIPVGKYILKSSYNNFKKETPFEVKAGETTKVHVTFGQFLIEAKCSDMNEKISYEVYASSGQLVNEKKIKCSDMLKMTLDNGDYSVEAKVGNDTKEVKFTVGGANSKLLMDMTDIKKEPTKEELIKADSQETSVNTLAPKQEEQKSEKITIGDKQIEIKGMSQKDADKIKELGAILGAFSGMMQGANPEAQKKQAEKQNADNAKADKEFDDMSKELDMFTK